VRRRSANGSADWSVDWSDEVTWQA
jgi:hypothetical protein